MSTLPAQQGPRQLGLRVRPVMKLKIGAPKPERGVGKAIDHFRPTSDNTLILDKFNSIYPPPAKAVDVLLPNELRRALSIKYWAWGGAGDEEGGVPKAWGDTNFALENFCGGPDLLTVLNPDGTVSQVEITGLDDPIAQELGLDLETTFTAHLPKVLGLTETFSITTKGKASTDTLWLKLHELYSLFGMRVKYAIMPQLVVRMGTAHPLITNKEGQKQRIHTKIPVLDLIVPESLEESIERLRERAALLPGGPAAALYGGNGGTRELPPATVDYEETGTELPPAEVPPAADGATGEAEAHTVAAAASPSPRSQEDDFSDEPGASGFTAPGNVEATPEVLAAQKAAEFVVEIGKEMRGKKLRDAPESWLDYMLTRLDPSEPKTAALCEAIRAFTRIYQPELYQKAMAAKGVAV